MDNFVLAVYVHVSDFLWLPKMISRTIKKQSIASIALLQYLSGRKKYSQFSNNI